MPDWFWILVVFGYGAIVGSFLNVVIYRMPLGLALSTPPSHCPRCNTLLRFWDNIPLLSFLTLGGRCRYCRTSIGWRYFTVELMTACLWVCLFHRITGADIAATSFIPLVAWTDFVFQALFASVLIALIFIDLDHFFVPDELNAVGFGLALIRDVACIGLVFWLVNDAHTNEYREKFLWWGWLPRAFVGAAVYGGLMYAVSFFSFVYYARGENESLGGVVQRFWTLEELPEDVPAAGEETVGKPGEEIVPEEFAQDTPIRLRFAPAFLSFVAALLLSPVVGVWGTLGFLLPWIFFTLMTKGADETIVQSAARFFRVSDLPMDASARMTETQPFFALTPEEQELLTDTEKSAYMAQEADQFARESESGKHGGMGLGDVKLALAIGAILGPGLALLSLLFATFLGAFLGILLARIHGKSLRYGLPFVPFMAFGAILAMLYGDAFIGWYMQRSGLTRPPIAEQRILPPLNQPIP